MAKAEEIGKKETQQNISMQLVNLPRNLFQRFMSSNNHFSHRNHEEEEEIELSLGLSLNGRFGVDPRANKLTRSSSIPDFINNSTREDTNEYSSSLFPMACGSLVRTCSLPTETEEEWRKRKELQSLRRMEAKRKRSEKQKNLKAVRDRKRGGFGEENCEEDKREEAGNGDSWVNGGRGPCEGVAASQGSIGSQGTGSSGISELESQPAQGIKKFCPPYLFIIEKHFSCLLALIYMCGTVGVNFLMLYSILIGVIFTSIPIICYLTLTLVCFVPFFPL